MLKIEKTHFSFFLLWFPIVSVCIYVGTLLAVRLGDYLYLHNGRSESASNDGDWEFVFSLILLVGLFMGFGQWIVLNTKIKKIYGWLLATPIGFSVGSFIFFRIFVFIRPTLFPNLFEHYEILRWGVPFGIWLGTCIFTGMCQWMALGRNMLDSFKWSVVMTVSFSTGIALEFFSQGTNFMIFSIAVGSISGVFAEPLIIRPASQKHEIAI